MNQKVSALTFLVCFTISAVHSDAQAQEYYYPSSGVRATSQSRIVVGTQPRVYTNNGVRYQSFRPSYGQSQVYSDGRVYVQPRQTYSSNPHVYYGQPSGTVYYGNPTNGQPYYSNSPQWNQPQPVYQSNYGTGYYSNPRPSANANAGAIIGGAIGGNQGAQVGAAIGAAIRP